MNITHLRNKSAIAAVGVAVAAAALLRSSSRSGQRAGGDHAQHG